MDRIDAAEFSGSIERPPADDEPQTGTGESSGETEAEANDTEHRLPTLPVVPEGIPNSKPVLEKLIAFYNTGQQPATPAARVVPALFHPYRDITRIRHDYPICITRDGDIRTLVQVIDDVTAQVATDGDEGERLRRHLLRLEVEIRGLAGPEPVRLSQLWDDAVIAVLAKSTLDKKHKRLMEENLGAARKALDVDGQVVDYGPRVPRMLFEAVTSQEWCERCEEWRDELAAIVRQLEDILRVDSSHSPQASTPEHLRSSTGAAGDELDFDAMSSLLSTSRLGDPLPASRRDRIRDTLNMLRLVQPLFASGDLGGDAPINANVVVDTCAAAAAQYEARMKIMTDFFRAVRIARIEIANGYREAVHDPFFDNFGPDALTAEELALCPPVLLALDQDVVSDEELGRLLALAGRGLAVKALVVIDDLFVDESLLGWPRRLAGMATGLGNAFVLQCTAADLAYITTGISEGHRFDGTAIFSVCSGGTFRRDDVAPYVLALAAGESRMFPSFRYDPSRGDTWLARMDISANAQADARWVEETFACQTAEGAEEQMTLPLTPADLLLCDDRRSAHFMVARSDMWHERMVPVHEYVAHEPARAEGEIPYVLAVDEDGEVVRVVVSRVMARTLTSVATDWHRLQELGGIDNSYALDALQREADRLEKEKDSAIETLEARYKADLERDLAEVTQEIVRRIAAQLLAEGTSAPAPLRTPAVAPATPAAPKTPETGAAEGAPATEAAGDEDEEEVVTLDDPYIDTPLCTSCNDCFKINDRLFAYNDNKQAYIADATAGTYRELVLAAEACPVHIIHPGKPRNPDEPGLDEWIKRAERFM